MSFIVQMKQNVLLQAINFYSNKFVFIFCDLHKELPSLIHIILMLLMCIL